MDKNNSELKKRFVEQYNRRVEWSREILEKLGLDPTVTENPCVKQIVEGYLTTEPIDDWNYNLANASIYPLDTPGKYELQAYSYERYCTSYFWVNLNETKEGYINERIAKISRAAKETIDRLRPDYEKLLSNITALGKLDEKLREQQPRDPENIKTETKK